MNKVVAIIPVRLESSRLPEKALKDICGLPMIVHTWQRASLSKLVSEVYVATDSDIIKGLIESYGGKVIMTSPSHKNGSERTAEAARSIEAELIVNVQGDEALVDPECIDAGVEGLRRSDAEVSLLMCNYNKRASPSDIKVVTNLKGEVLYLSRTDIPSDARAEVASLLKAYHVVTFRKDFLLIYANLASSPLECIEFNEYLRVLENGYKIQGVKVDSDAVSVDTEEDLKFVRQAMISDKYFPLYKPNS